MQLSAKIRLPFRGILSTFFLLHTMARADLLWHGDPDKWRAVFDNLTFEGAATHSKGTILPAAKRTTWTWGGSPWFEPDTPPEPSRLLGPVTLHAATRVHPD